MSILDVEMKKKDKSELIYDNLINYKICESLYINMKKTNYITFRNMCNNLKVALDIGNIQGELRVIITSTGSDIEHLYAIPFDETMKLIYQFLTLSEISRTRYLNAMQSIKKATPNSYFEKRTKKGGRG